MCSNFIEDAKVERYVVDASKVEPIVAGCRFWKEWSDVADYHSSRSRLMPLCF